MNAPQIFTSHVTRMIRGFKNVAPQTKVSAVTKFLLFNKHCCVYSVSKEARWLTNVFTKSLQVTQRFDIH